MLVNSARRHSKSHSCTLLQKEIEKDNKALQISRKISNPEFVPYCQERRLGRLITKQENYSTRKPNEG
jgi:hypothetical protein